MASAKLIEKIQTDFKNYLKRGNLRATEQRYEVLNSILQIDGHFDAEELFIKMKSAGKKVSRATVYNTLDLLFELGVVSRHKVGNVFVYERAFGRAHHDHLICINCRAIIEFRSEEIERLQDEICKRYKFKPIRHTHQIFGLCAKCAEKEK
ncbi:MAG: Fur family transcriptional regulator [Candidatus Kryptonium sp.]